MDRRIPPLLLVIATATGVFGQALLVGATPGLNIPVLVVVVMAALVAVRRAGARIDPSDAWIPPVAVALAAAPALRADPSLVVVDLLGTAALMGAAAAAISGVAVTRRSTLAILALGASLLELVAVGAARLARMSRRWTRIDPIRLGPTARAVLRGLVLAVPVLLVFAGLFAAADAVFARVVETALDWQIDLGEIPGRLLVAGAIAWPIAGLLGVAAYGVPAIEARSLGAAARWPGTRPAEGAPPRSGVEALVVLLAVDVLFVVFVVLQIAYLFGGRDTLAASGLTYSDYARRGFFELVAVAVLAGTLVAALRAFVATSNRFLVGGGLALVGLTAVVLLSAAVRLRLYQEAYGWTELRFYVAVAIGGLVIALAATGVLVVRDGMDRLPHALGLLILTGTVAVTAVGPRGYVADQNVERLLDPTLIAPDGYAGFDIDYRTLLGDEAIPALVRAVDHTPPAQAAALRAFLAARRLELAGDEERSDWRSWNLSRERALEALRSLDG